MRYHERAMRRWQFYGPQAGAVDDVPWWKAWYGHGGDEYGNCSVYAQSCLLGGFCFFWDPHFQLDIEVPLSRDDATAADWRAWYERRYLRPRPRCARRQRARAHGRHDER